LFQLIKKKSSKLISHSWTDRRRPSSSVEAIKKCFCNAVWQYKVHSFFNSIQSTEGISFM